MKAVSGGYLKRIEDTDEAQAKRLKVSPVSCELSKHADFNGQTGHLQVKSVRLATPCSWAVLIAPHIPALCEFERML